MTDWTKVAEKVALELAGEAANSDETGALSAQAFSLICDAGLHSALVPVEFGGGGATHSEMGAILRILGSVDAATAVTLSMHSHVVAAQVWRNLRGLDASAFLSKVAGGTLVASGGASDWVSSSGTAVQVSGGFRVSARKAPISGCEVCDVLAGSIRWEDGPGGPSVIHCSIPLGGEGVSIEHTWDSLGLRATGSHTVVLDDVFVPDEAVALIRPADQWHPAWSAVISTVKVAVEVVGGSAYTRGALLERLYRDALGGTFHPLPRSRQLEFTGRVAAGQGAIAAPASTRQG